MKRIFTVILFTMLVAAASAQAPQKLSYQAVIRNTSDQLVTNTTVGMQISILQGSATGTVVYSETQTPTTNANGLVSIEIGNGVGFDAIDWSNGPYFIKTETDISGGSTYTISGTSELLSVPYALHAKTAESVVGGITETDPVFDLSAAATISSSDITNWNNKLSTEVDGDITNEIQILSISNDTIRLTNGGYVKLPAGFDGQYSSLTGAPTNVSTFTNDAMYLTSFTEVDGDITNELQILSISNDTIRLTNGGFVKLPAGFDGQYSSLIGAPTNVSSFTNDAGYLTSFTEIDPEVGINTTNYVSKWNGTSLVSSMIFDDGTNVGIGTTTPAYKLDVAADAQINGVRVGRGGGNQASNVMIGSYALMTNSSGFANTAVGFYSLFSNTTGSTNTAIGQHTLYANTIGKWNTALGCQALTNNIDGNSNTALGLQSLGANTTGDNNTAVGRDALLRNTTGNNNVALGQEAGFNGISGSKNVFLGYQTGYNEYGSNKLYIANSSTSTPLIYGDFSTATLTVYSNLNINNAYTFPNADGTNGQILSTNGAGVLGWNSLATVATNGSYNDLIDQPLLFDGQYSSLTGAPTNVSSFTNDAGYLTSFTEVDGDVTNEIEMPDDANAGDMAYFDGSAWVKIPKGNDNQILTLQAGIPTWQNQFALPTATSTVATYVTATTATLNGIVNANGLSTVVTFEYGPTTSYGTTVSAIQSPVTGTVNTNVSADISGLVDGTTYHFRIKAENAIGVVYSAEMSFQFLSVGESYQGGIVGYILLSGDPGYEASIQHGIIAAPSDQSTNAQWGCINSLLCSEITTEGMPIGKGNQNTTEIIYGCPTLGIAARLCGDLVLGGYNDWFLPSYNELMQLYLNKGIIGGLSNAEYWSSSEGTSWYAYTLNFSNGAFGYPNKDYGHYVRAVRAF